MNPNICKKCFNEISISYIAYTEGIDEIVTVRDPNTRGNSPIPSLCFLKIKNQIPFKTNIYYDKKDQKQIIESVEFDETQDFSVEKNCPFYTEHFFCDIYKNNLRSKNEYLC